MIQRGEQNKILRTAKDSKRTSKSNKKYVSKTHLPVCSFYQAERHFDRPSSFPLFLLPNTQPDRLKAQPRVKYYKAEIQLIDKVQKQK